MFFGDQARKVPCRRFMLATAMEGLRRSMQVQSKQQQRLEEVLDKLFFFFFPSAFQTTEMRARRTPSSSIGWPMHIHILNFQRKC